LREMQKVASKALSMEQKTADERESVMGSAMAAWMDRNSVDSTAETMDNKTAEKSDFGMVGLTGR
jgi:hypothetical protein